MKFIEKHNLQILSRILLLLVFIPAVIVLLFIAVPIIMSIACVIFIIMLFTRKKFNRNVFFVKINKTHFDKNKQTSSKKYKNNEYYDAKYISIDDENKK